MDISSILSTALKLGLPILVLSWLLFSWLYRKGRLEINADHKETAENLKALKKRSKEKGQHGQNYILDKWMWFGSGFYGLSALWTFIVIELVDIANFLFSFPGVDSLFADGLFKTFAAIILNQIQNIVSAFIWFNYWPDSSAITSLLIAYLSYIIGMELAKRFNIELPRKP